MSAIGRKSCEGRKGLLKPLQPHGAKQVQVNYTVSDPNSYSSPQRATGKAGKRRVGLSSATTQSIIRIGSTGVVQDRRFLPSRLKYSTSKKLVKRFREIHKYGKQKGGAISLSSALLFRIKFQET